MEIHGKYESEYFGLKSKNAGRGCRRAGGSFCRPLVKNISLQSGFKEKRKLQSAREAILCL